MADSNTIAPETDIVDIIIDTWGGPNDIPEITGFMGENILPYKAQSDINWLNADPAQRGFFIPNPENLSNTILEIFNNGEVTNEELVQWGAELARIENEKRSGEANPISLQKISSTDIHNAKKLLENWGIEDTEINVSGAVLVINLFRKHEYEAIEERLNQDDRRLQGKFTDRVGNPDEKVAFDTTTGDQVTPESDTPDTNASVTSDPQPVIPSQRPGGM
ncbi:MAG: hypothetical protein OEY94_02605 [Alphaproteobacteria bacterium]|nr:hypothetical protein [Alphaproteobacteria bacterium]